jgi:membrane protein implicated in regulation of membrane protease activity
MLKFFAAIVGTIFLLAGVVVAVLHYLLETGLTMKFVTLAIAAVLLIVGWALVDWSRRLSRRQGGNDSSGSGTG